MGLTTLIHLSPKQGSEQEVITAIQAYAKAIEASETEITEYRCGEIVETSEDGGKEIITLTKFTSKEAMEAHIIGPAFSAVRKCEDLLRKPVVVKHITDVGGFRR